MTNEELEAGYDAALAEYNDKAGMGANEARYFFWAGATFGTQLCQKIYSEAKPQIEIDDFVGNDGERV